MAQNKTLMNVYEQALQAVLEDRKREELRKLVKGENKALDCLFSPHEHPVVWRLEPCECDPTEQEHCAAKCSYEAIVPNGDGGVVIDADKCLGCAECIDRCTMNKLSASKDTFSVLQMLQDKGKRDELVYAIVAPAFIGQYSAQVTSGKLREAFETAGFDGMIECALFADVLTLKEALEFDANIREESDFQLTSCCCPMWIAMIRRSYHEMLGHVPGSVSPMIAAGRAVKKIRPNAKTVFIGPCLAKKAEAREKDIAGAIDAVLTFEEMQDIFDALKISLVDQEDKEENHASRAGRIYARVGGVSEAVSETLSKIAPGRKLSIKTKHADGVKACKEMLSALREGKHEANFYEGMGCVGGCVGGPKAILPAKEGTENVNRFADEANYMTPADNPYVLELLNRLHLDSIEELVKQSDIFTRDFD